MEFPFGKKGYSHFTSWLMRAFAQFVVGSDSYIAYQDSIEPEILAGNIIRIPSLMLFHHGGLFVVKETDDVTYQNGTQGMKRIDLIVARYTKDTEGLESGSWVVIQGTPDDTSPVAPDYTEGNMQEGDLIDDCPVFRITMDGINVESVELLLPKLKPLSQKQNQITGTESEPSGGEDGDVFIQFEE